MTTNATIARAREMRRTLTPPEARLWVARRCLTGNGFHFRRQAPFGRYFLDFVCHAGRLAIEVDGIHPGEPEQARDDARRDAVLAREGYRTLRFTAADMQANLEGVVAAIWLALDQAPPPLRGAERHPPPARDGEGMA